MPRKRSAKAKRAVDETLRKFFELGANGFASVQPQFPGIKYPDGKEFPPDALKQVWILEKAEIDAICDPICEMLPDLSETAQDRLARLMNPLALVIAAYAVTMPRIHAHRQITNYVRQYNAGFTAPTQNTNSPTGNNGNGTNVNPVNPVATTSTTNPTQSHKTATYDAASVTGIPTGLSTINANKF